MTDTQTFAIDLGNKQTKAMSSKTQLRVPSHFAQKNNDGLSDFSIGDNQLDIHTFSGLGDDRTYVWGKDIDKYNVSNDMQDTIGFGVDRYKDNLFLLLSQFTIGLLAKDFNEEKLHVNIVTGIPTEDYDDDNCIKALKNALKRNVLMDIDGKQVNVQVDKVNVLPQPVGTVVDSIKSEKKKDLQNEYINIVDIGGGTLLLDLLNNLEYQSSENRQFKYGAYVLYNNIAIKSGIRPRPSIYRIEDMVRKGFENDGKFIYHVKKNTDYDITETVEDEINNYTGSICSKIKHNVFELDSIDEIIFTGGGSSIINKDIVKNEFPEAIFAKHGEMSNVFGFYEYGLQINK